MLYFQKVEGVDYNKTLVNLNNLFNTSYTNVLELLEKEENAVKKI